MFNFNHERFVISVSTCRFARLCYAEALYLGRHWNGPDTVGDQRRGRLKTIDWIETIAEKGEGGRGEGRPTPRERSKRPKRRSGLLFSKVFFSAVELSERALSKLGMFGNLNQGYTD